jgi:TatD DNase family protein
VEFVDSHCHLDDKQFDADRADVIERARTAGLKYMLAIGTGDGPPDLEAAVRLAEIYPFIHATVGVHPNDAEKSDSNTFRNLRTLLGHPKVRAVGEIGLDYHWGVPKEIQLPVFRRQMELAAEAKMPIVIHTRDAWDDTIAALRDHWAPTGLPCVLHCFTGDADRARECLDLGFLLGFGGVTTFPKSTEVREAARITPLERMLIETDAPYLAPVPNRGKRNEPALVVHTARMLADLRAVSQEEFATQTTANFERIFDLSCQTSQQDSTESSKYTEGFHPRV